MRIGFLFIKLSENNSFLETEIDKVNSLAKVEGRIKNLELVKVGEVKYIFITEDYLARETQ